MTFELLEQASIVHCVIPRGYLSRIRKISRRLLEAYSKMIRGIFGTASSIGSYCGEGPTSNVNLDEKFITIKEAFGAKELLQSIFENDQEHSTANLVGNFDL